MQGLCLKISRGSIIACCALLLAHCDVAENEIDDPCQNSSQFSATDCALKKMTSGHAEYHAPADIRFGETKDIELRLAGDARSVAEVKQWASDMRAHEGGQIGAGDIRLSGSMDAQLTGEGFKIALVNANSTQPVSWISPTIWQWHVTAEEGDDWFPWFSTDRELTLAVSAVIPNSKPRLITTFERTIKVHVSGEAWTHRAVELGKDLWWVWTTLAAAITGFIAWWRKKPARP